MRVNREIRAPLVRVIGKDGMQLGVISISEALSCAEQQGLDLVEISPSAEPPVCKIVDFGKYRYQLTKREREGKKSQHQLKVKEVKFKINIDEHDFDTKVRHARDFIAKGNKVKVSCIFRGRELSHPEIGKKLMQRICTDLQDIAVKESDPKLFGKSLTVVLASGNKKKHS